MENSRIRKQEQRISWLNLHLNSHIPRGTEDERLGVDHKCGTESIYASSRHFFQTNQQRQSSQILN